MPETSGQCEDELCLEESNPLPIRVFPCLYHCKKMLCIRHLSEHDKYTEEEIQYRKQIENLWNNYISIFNEEKVQREYERLKTKLDNHEKLKDDIKSLLLINHFHVSIENNQKFQMAIETLEKAIEQENNQSESFLGINNINAKIELETNDDQENQQTMNYESLSSPLHLNNNGSETIDSPVSPLSTNENLPPTEPDNEYLRQIVESDDYGNSMEFENEDHTMEDSSYKDETSVTSKRKITASKLRGYCPLTEDGAFGISCHSHGIRLCSKKNGNQRTCRLYEHFRRAHHLTPLASLTLARAICLGQDPETTKLFDDNNIILNIDELRTVVCPISKPFINYLTLNIPNTPCDTIRQVRHLREHLKHVHKFTNKAANIIVKGVKADTAIHKIQFPRWIDIIED